MDSSSHPGTWPHAPSIERAVNACRSACWAMLMSPAEMTSPRA